MIFIPIFCTVLFYILFFIDNKRFKKTFESLNGLIQSHDDLEIVRQCMEKDMKSGMIMLVTFISVVLITLPALGIARVVNYSLIYSLSTAPMYLLPKKHDYKNFKISDWKLEDIFALYQKERMKLKLTILQKKEIQ